MSPNVKPKSLEAPAPELLRPPGPDRRVSRVLPESLKPATTPLPHHAVDVSLWVKPPMIERRKSVEGLDTGIGPEETFGAAERRPSSRAAFRFASLASLSGPSPKDAWIFCQASATCK